MRDFNKALNYSFLLLKYRPRAKGELAQRLKLKKYSSSVIKKVLTYLEESAYIDDQEFARLFVSSCLQKGWGRRRIDYTLKKFGVDESIRIEALGDDQIYRERMREIMKKKIAYYKGKKNAFSKVLRSLLSRGFEYSDIMQEMQNVRVNRFEN